MKEDDELIPIAIDHGFSHTKTKDDIFQTGVSVIDAPISYENVLEIDDRCYRIGGTRMDVLEDKTSTDDFLLLTYAAIAMALDRLDRKKARVILAVGLPIGRLAREKEAFRQYLMKNRVVKYHYGRKAFIVTIENVFVYPQCYGAVADRLPTMKSEELVVDIGSWTVDTLMIINHSPDESRCGSDPNGLIPCMRKIDEECVRRFNTKVGESLIREVMIRGDADIDWEYIEVIEKALTRYAKSVFHIIRETGVNVKTTPITFVGGGATLMRRYAGIGQKNIHYIEDVRANARGYDLLLRAYLKKKGMIV